MNDVELRFGLGAWSNAHFDHILYPLRTPHTERLARYASLFPVAEADILHHRMPEAAHLAEWIDQTPPGFRFLPKMHKDVTHPGGRQRGRPTEGAPTDPLAAARAFLDALDPLEAAGKCGPVLVQYAKDFTFGDRNLNRLAQVLALRGPGTFAVELRHASWWNEETEALLARHQAALVWSTYDMAPAPPWATADFGYVRFVGTTGKTRDRWVTKRDRLEDVLEIRRNVAQARDGGAWRECFVIVTNRFEGNAIDSLPRIAAALDETELAKRVSRRPGEPLLAAGVARLTDAWRWLA